MHTVRSTCTGGMQAPEPSNTIAPGPSPAARAAPSAMLDSAGSPPGPPPPPLQPTGRPPPTSPRAARHRALEVIGGRMAPALRDRHQLVEREPRLGNRGLAGPSSPH